MCCCERNRFFAAYGVILILVWEIQAVRSRDTYEEPAHVRTWTDWYDTDTPVIGGEDDERVTSIRKRGNQICNGLSPIDALCRDVKQHALMFNSDSTHVTSDTLAVACTTSGIMCRNSDQRNKTCRNYEIRFECLGAKAEPPPPNFGVIGVAAGLSVIVPIVCVAIMHVARLCRDRRNPRSRHNLLPGLDNSEQSSQTDISDLPPSYSLLFPDRSSLRHDSYDDGSNITNSTGLTVSLVAPIVDSFRNSNLTSARLNSGSLSNLHDYEDAVEVTQPLRGSDAEHQQHQRRPRTQSWRSRFPNMHLSVFDLFMTSDRTSQHSTSIPPSPDLSYVQTPPPTYNEALVFMKIKSETESYNDTRDIVESNDEIKDDRTINT